MTTDEIIGSQENETIKYEEIQKALDDSIKIDSFDFRDTVNKVIKGEYDISPSGIIKKTIEKIFYEVRLNFKLMAKVVGICVILAIFTHFTNTFKNKQVSDTGYFVVFLLISILIIQSYNAINSIAINVITSLLNFIQALVPSLFAATIVSGAPVSSVIFNQYILVIIGIIDFVMLKLILPFFYVLVVLTIINAITDEEILNRTIELFKKGIEWSVKLLLWVFVGILGLQSFTTPIVEGVASKSAKTVIGFVPVIGSSLGEVSNVVLGCGSIIKNGLGVAALIAIGLIVIMPILKILGVIIIYKSSAAIIEAVSDKRLVNCLSNMGSIFFMLLAMILIVSLMFVISIAITLYATNISMYIR
jgi:stage III sporulation protein AE